MKTKQSITKIREIESTNNNWKHAEVLPFLIRRGCRMVQSKKYKPVLVLINQLPACSNSFYWYELRAFKVAEKLNEKAPQNTGTDCRADNPG